MFPCLLLRSRHGKYIVNSSKAHKHHHHFTLTPPYIMMQPPSHSSSSFVSVFAYPLLLAPMCLMVLYVTVSSSVWTLSNSSWILRHKSIVASVNSFFYLFRPMLFEEFDSVNYIIYLRFPPNTILRSIFVISWVLRSIDISATSFFLLFKFRMIKYWVVLNFHQILHLLFSVWYHLNF